VDIPSFLKLNNSCMWGTNQKASLARLGKFIRLGQISLLIVCSVYNHKSKWFKVIQTGQLLMSNELNFNSFFSFFFKLSYSFIRLGSMVLGSYFMICTFCHFEAWQSMSLFTIEKPFGFPQKIDSWVNDDRIFIFWASFLFKTRFFFSWVCSVKDHLLNFP